MTDDLAGLAQRYLEYYAMQARGDPGLDSRFDDWEAVQDVVNEGAERGLLLLRLLVENAPDDGALQFIAAGPLEDYVCWHGATMIAQVIEEAEREPKFARALAGVWGANRMGERSRSEIEAWRRRRGVHG